MNVIYNSFYIFKTISCPLKLCRLISVMHPYLSSEYEILNDDLTESSYTSAP